MATPLLLAVLLLFAVVAGAYFYSSRSDEPILQEDGTLMEGDDAMKSGDDPLTETTVTPDVSGTIAIATGTVGEYSKAAYDTAIASGKVVVLYYFANWCPICKVEFPKFQSAVQQLSDDRFVALRVNFNDSETTPEEEASAREHQVGYQHTIVIIRRGEQVYKSQSVDNYQTTITEYLPS